MHGLPTNSKDKKTNTFSLSKVGAILFIGLLLALCPRPAGAATTMVTVGDGGFFFFPSSVTIDAGDTVQWTWSASGHSSTSGTPGQPSGFWDSGVLNQGATFSHMFPAAGSFPYFCTPHGACCGMVGSVTVSAPTPTPTPTPTATPTPTPTPRPPSQGQLLNISTRMHVQTGENVLIGGFIVTGSEPKKVILRAIGPSLPLTGVLANPTLELHDGSGTIASNDNWMDAPNKQEIIDSTIPPSNDFESAILISLDPGPYTAIVSGVNNTTGIGLVEAYDLDQPADSQLANISTRGFVESGNNVMIGGFILGNGTGTTNLLIRALGPSLAGQGVSGVLADPTLELRDENGNLVQGNDNWKDSQQTEIEATGIPPENELESALVVTLSPAAYTAIVAGTNGTTGVGLVEVYRLP